MSGLFSQFYGVRLSVVGSGEGVTYYEVKVKWKRDPDAQCTEDKVLIGQGRNRSQQARVHEPGNQR